MPDDDSPRSFILLLGEEGLVAEVLRGDPELMALELGRPFPELFDSVGFSQGFEFLGSLRAKGALYGWELFRGGRVPRTLHCGGACLDDGRMIVVAAGSAEGLRQVCEDEREAGLVPPAAAQRMLESARAGKAEHTPTSVTELASLYSDLAELQREASERSEELGRVSAERGRILAMVAHDLRNPLNAIRLLAGLVAESAGERLNDEERGYLDRVERSSAKMGRLLDELLEASRFELDPPHVDCRRVDLVEVVRSNLAINAPIAARKRIRVELVEPEGPVPVEVDVDRFDQILDNLVSNAVKFSAPDTAVSVRILRRDAEAVITVTDQGPGIPQEELAEVFRPFARTSVRPTGGEESFGVGLAISRQLARAHGGEIEVETEVGRGSSFTVRLPAAS